MYENEANVASVATTTDQPKRIPMSAGRWTLSKIAEPRKPHSENMYVSDSIGMQAIALRTIARRKTPVQRCR